MSARRIRITYDYVDPGSYLAARLLDRWTAAGPRELEISWVPLELSAPPSLPVDARAPEWSAMSGAMRRHAAVLEIPFSPPARIPWSRKAHELALHARERGCFDSVHRALFEAHFSGSEDIGRIDTLADIAAAGGLDPGEVRTVLGVDRYRPEVERLRRAARRAGIRGVPTFESGGARLEGFRAPSALWRFLGAEVGPTPGGQATAGEDPPRRPEPGCRSREE